jgi:Ras-related protein Rab-5C
LVGDSQVGKTCLVTYLTTGAFKGSDLPTIGAAFQNHIMSTPSGSIALQIWDTAGQEKYRALTPMYYRRANVAILVFDLTRAESFESLSSWLGDLSNQHEGEIKLFLAGNKLDLAKEREVSLEDAQKFVQSHGIVGYFETSAKTGEGIAQLFTSVAEIGSQRRRPVDDPLPEGLIVQDSKCC